MARPPIIVSNQGVFSRLAKGCTGKDNVKEVIDQMKINLEELNELARNDDPDRPILRRIESAVKKKDAKFLWCLASEPIEDMKNKFDNWDYIKDKKAELSG